MAPKKKAASYYKTVGGVKYDRQLLEQAEAAAAGGQISVKDAQDLWKAASDGTGVTETERRTLEYVLQEMKFTVKAAEFLRKQLRQRKGSSFYKIIAGVKYDRELLEKAEEAAKDGQISLADAKQLWEKALDGSRVTETERRTLEYVLNNLKCTHPAANFLREKLGAVQTQPDDPVESEAAAPEDETVPASEHLTGGSSSSTAAAPSGAPAAAVSAVMPTGAARELDAQAPEATAHSMDEYVDGGVATSHAAVAGVDAAWAAASPMEAVDEVSAAPRAEMPAELEETEDENSPCAVVTDAAPGNSTSQHGLAASTVAELPVIARLRAEAAAPSEWRREALSCRAEGKDGEFMKILEASLEDGIPLSEGPERAISMLMIAGQLVSKAVAQPRPTKLEAETLLSKAKVLLDKADALQPVANPSLESIIIKGFHALGLHLLQSPKSGQNSDNLKLAELLFEAALKSDRLSPRAILGKAVVMGQRGEWGKALDLFRSVLQQAGTPAPRTGLRLRALKELRFAMAVCFACLARTQQAKNALTGVVAADSLNVESLCALAQLGSRDSAEAGDQSMEHLGVAMRADQSHPVVLCHAANHAFYCGLEDGAGATTNADGNQYPASWKMAQDLLDRAMTISKSNSVIAEIRYQRGRLQHAKGHYDDAYSEYRACCELVPEHYACAYSFAQTCLRLQKVHEAIAALETVKKASPKSPEVLKLLTFAYLHSGSNEKQAVKCADALVAVSKNDVECWAMRAEAHERLAVKQPNSTASKVVADAYEAIGKLLKEDEATTYAASPQMWNNLGTMRSLQGDTTGAKEAYRHGLEVVQQRLERVNGSQEESIDLQVASLTMRFNRAFLAESQAGQQDVTEAINEYLQLSEENNWYAETLLQLGAQWQRLGKSDSAERMFQQAVKHNPFLGFLMQAETHRSQDDYPKALKFAEQVVQKAGKTQFHYAHVYSGNLHFEVACAPMTKSKDKDNHLRKALQHFIQALQHEKDSHHAANGIGMVFAERGKHDFAKRTFQSVMQHKAMPTNPSLYINLGHTYLGSDSGNPASVKKAIALYEQAKKLHPDDSGVRLYIAKAHFLLQDYDACMNVLGDATQIWPENILVRYNLALVLEKLGANLVKEVKKSRTFGGPKEMQKVTQAVEFLDSAQRLWRFVETKWSIMTERERRFLARSSGAPESLPNDMEDVSGHVEYCNDIALTAKDALLDLAGRESELRGKMQAIQDEKMQATNSEKVFQDEEEKKKADQQTEAEDQALRLMDSTREIVLGKNLESVKIDKGPSASRSKGKAKATPGVNPDIAIVSRDPEVQPIADALGDDDFGVDPLAGDDRVLGDVVGAPGDEIGAVDDDRRRRRREKKGHKSDPKHKREDGGKRKKRRRRREESDDAAEEVPRDEDEYGLFEPGEEATSVLPLQSGEAGDDSMGVQPEDDQDDGMKEKKKKKKHKKDEKKDKDRDKKGKKKEKKEKKGKGRWR